MAPLPKPGSSVVDTLVGDDDPVAEMLGRVRAEWTANRDVRALRRLLLSMLAALEES